MHITRSQTNRSKIFYFWLCILVGVGILLEAYVSASREGSSFDNSAIRVINLFVYFTIFSNILVAISSHSYYRNNGKNISQTMQSLHVASIICIVTTLIIHRLYLAGPLSGVPLISDLIIHLIVPIFACIGWLFYSAREKISLRVGLLAIGYPTAWLIATFARGLVTDWYPYTFLDPQLHTTSEIFITLSMIYGLMFTILGMLVTIQTMFQKKR